MVIFLQKLKNKKKFNHYRYFQEVTFAIMKRLARFTNMLRKELLSEMEEVELDLFVIPEDEQCNDEQLKERSRLVFLLHQLNQEIKSRETQE